MRRTDLSPENRLKPRLTILLNNPCTHNQRYYVVDVVRHRKVSAAGILKLEQVSGVDWSTNIFCIFNRHVKLAKFVRNFLPRPCAEERARTPSSAAGTDGGRVKARPPRMRRRETAVRDTGGRTTASLESGLRREREGRRSGSRVKILCRELHAAGVLRLLQWSLHFG